MPVKRVMFIRPGETEWNKNGRWQGQVAVPLNAHGQTQVERLAQFLVPINLDALYSSDLRRAKDTAETIKQKTGVRLTYDQRLRERSMGEWQGLTQNEVVEWYPQEYERVLNDPENYQIPGGEARRQVADRVRAAFDDIVARGGETIGIVSHTTAIRSLLNDLVPASNPPSTFKNMSVTTIMHDGENWKIAQFDDVTHLEGMETRMMPDPDHLEHEVNES